MNDTQNNQRDRKIHFTIDGETFTGAEGDTIASALYANGIRSWRRGKNGDPRGLLCGIGICFDCLVSVDGVAWIRACQMEIYPGMCVETFRKDGEAT